MKPGSDLNWILNSKSDWKPNPCGKNIRIGTLNIIDGRANRLEIACKTMEEHNIDIGQLTKAKLNGAHRGFAYKYNVNTTKADNQSRWSGCSLLKRKIMAPGIVQTFWKKYHTEHLDHGKGKDYDCGGIYTSIRN